MTGHFPLNPLNSNSANVPFRAETGPETPDHDHSAKQIDQAAQARYGSGGKSTTPSTSSSSTSPGHHLSRRKDGELNTQSGIRRYSERTISLLCEYLSGDISKSDNAELAGRLVFPNSDEAASLFGAQTRKPLSKANEALLEGLTHYPGDTQAVALHAQQASNRKALSPADLARIYAARRYPNNSDEARILAKNTNEIWAEFRDQEKHDEDLARALCSFVRTELLADDYAISTTGELAEYFGGTTKRVHSLLTDRLHGLEEDELNLRQRKLERVAEMRKYALPRLIIQGLSTLTHIETELKRTGYIEELSTPEELAELFGESQSTIINYLKVVPAGQLYLQTDNTSVARRLEDRTYMVESVRKAIRLHKEGSLVTLRTDSELAERLETLPVSVFHYLRDHLDKEEVEYRDFVLLQQGQQEEHRRSVIEFVKQEVQAFTRGEIANLSTNEELSSRFRVADSIIRNNLTGAFGGLNATEHEIRRFAITHQQRPDKFLDVLHQMTVLGVKERLEREQARIDRDIENADSELIESQGKTAHPRLQKVMAHEHEFDSLEEATAATCLKEFLPEYSLETGKTFQIPAANGRVDFRVGEALVEYHPMKAYWSKDGRGDFRTREEYQRYLEIRNSGDLSKTRRQLFIDETKARLEQEYRESRRQLIDSDPGLRGVELIVVTSPEELYHSVIKRFSDAPLTYHRFKKAWNRNHRVIQRIQKRLARERADQGES